MTKHRKQTLMSTTAFPKTFAPQSIKPITIDPTAPIEAQKAALDALIASKPSGSIVITITPELAAYILTLNFPKNRAKKPVKIREYSESMANGRWKLNGETVQFADDGYLHNGQNRMMACVRAGVPFTTHVIFGVPADSFDTIDTGKSRDGSDLLTSAGYSNSKRRAASLRWLMIFEGPNIANRGATFTAQQILDRQRKLDADGVDGEFNDALNAAAIIYRKRKIMVTSTMGALLFLYDAYCFAPRIASAVLRDVDLDRGGMHSLRLVLESLANRAARSVEDSVRNAYIIIALNAYARGKRMLKSDLNWCSTDPYPVPVWKKVLQP